MNVDGVRKHVPAQGGEAFPPAAHGKRIPRLRTKPCLTVTRL